MKFDFIRRERKEYKVIRLCEVLEVSSSGFYDWMDRPESRRARENRELTAKIRSHHERSREIYGSPKIHKDLVAAGETCGVNRVARLMQAGGIKSKTARKFVITQNKEQPTMNSLRKALSIVILAFAGTCSAGEWYEGGTLTDQGALIWQEASLANKIASSSDLVAAMYQKRLLNASITGDIKDVNDLAPYAIQLAVCIDGATKKQSDPQENKKIYTNQTVSGMAAICVMMMGWAI